MLTQEEVRALFNYNPETGDLTWKVNRGRNRGLIGKKAGVINRSRKHGKTGSWRVSVQVEVNGKTCMASRLIFLYMTGKIPQIVDFKNADPTDLRWDNLRAATRSLDTANAKMRSDNTSGHKGVFYSKRYDKWRAVIGVDGKKHHLGSFSSYQEAVQAYRKAAKQFFGEFARME